MALLVSAASRLATVCLVELALDAIELNLLYMELVLLVNLPGEHFNAVDDCMGPIVGHAIYFAPSSMHSDPECTRNRRAAT